MNGESKTVIFISKFQRRFENVLDGAKIIGYAGNSDKTLDISDGIGKSKPPP